MKTFWNRSERHLRYVEKSMAAHGFGIIWFEKGALEGDIGWPD
jgi:hypothetical protein